MKPSVTIYKLQMVLLFLTSARDEIISILTDDEADLEVEDIENKLRVAGSSTASALDEIKILVEAL